MDDDKLIPFSLDWLAEAGAKQKPLTVCDAGHMVVRGTTHWQPVRFAADLHALWCVPVDHPEGGDR